MIAYKGLRYCRTNCSRCGDTLLISIRPLLDLTLPSYFETERSKIMITYDSDYSVAFIVQELCESRGGRPELSVLTSLLVSVDVKIY